MTQRRTLFDQSHSYFVEAQARPIRLTNIEVVDKTSLAQNAFFGIPGTLTVFVARKGSAALHELREALKTGGQALIQLYRKVGEQALQVERWTLEEAVQATIQAPVFAELRYGGATLAQGLSVPQGLDMTVLFLPYNGGRLAQAGFILAERFKEGSDAALEALVVRIAPPLTEAEKAALQLVPTDQDINNVGLSDWCDTTWVAVAAVAAAAATPAAHALVTDALAAAALALIGFTSSALETHIPEETLRQLGPAASARKLLEMRREVLYKLPL
jgi:hypothetical protein